MYLTHGLLTFIPECTLAHCTDQVQTSMLNQQTSLADTKGPTSNALANLTVALPIKLNAHLSHLITLPLKTEAFLT